MSKRTHFILIYTTVTMESIARLFLHYVWKLYSLSSYVVLDRGLQFVALFTKKLYYLLRVEIASYTVWHS